MNRLIKLMPVFFRHKNLTLIAARAARKKGVKLFGTGFAIGRYIFIIAKVEH